MKRFISLLCSLLLIAAICSPAAALAKDKYFTDEQIEYYKNLGIQGTTVNVYNWGEYIADGSDGLMDVVTEFERLTGAKVNYSNFESNENMYSKLVGGGVSYDVITPSDYMIERLIDEKMLLELDYGNIPNIKYIDEKYKNLFFDPEQKYTVCFNTGLTVLIYNKKLVKETPDSWSVLWDEQYKNEVLMFNNSRDAFAIAQAMLDKDVNTANESDWVEAAELLAKQKDAVNPVYVMDEVFNLMESGEYAFATYYSGDYELMIENNPDLGFCFPKEGVNEFFDAFCIPKCAQNKKGAEAFINFMHEPQVAFDNAEYIYYASPNVTVSENEESSLYGSEAVYPDTQSIKTNWFHTLPQNILELQNTLWSQVKGGKLSADSKKEERKIYIISAIIAAGVVIILIFSFINRRKKNKEQDLSDLY
ncbi:MAG: spermidine/putrescine ABC transporter substrate-binding protein [Ruminococcaceae bacterium]|nr:spermidine/putrescine ABC transporter substrate-binding protein [Oscillospiraceae bacterium]